MPIDQTPYFKAHVKALLVEQENIRENDAKKADPSVSLAYKKMATHAFCLGKDLVEFRQLVLSRQRDYLSFNSPVRMMNDQERDEFDQETEKALIQLGHAIRRFAAQTSSDVLTAKEEKKHLSLVAESLDGYLKQLGKIVTDMRSLRLRNAAHQQKVQRLYNLVEAKQRRDKELRRDKVDLASMVRSLSPDLQPTIRQRHHTSQKDAVSSALTPSSILGASAGGAPDGWELDAAMPTFDSQENENDIDSRLSPQERTQLMAENERILDRFSHMHAQIEGLESQITEIQRLQETFAEKIMDQEKDIELINETALHTSANLIDGNEWIRQAISNSAGRRVVVLFCIIVITFTLLFLDWYNP
ncbi:hypothetical protein Q1695_002601 [Nippostrongylus brasiliensis]|nr:hypothetical protein Q1695_002601 [Nippostrongylus brasiliensis]